MERTGPDSVNSWLICFYCSLISMLLYGVVRLSGVLFVASMSKFQVDRQKASMPYVLCDFVQVTAGPITGYLGLRFGIRPIATLGSLFAAVGIGSCFLAEDIETVTVLWGVVYGLGFGLSSLVLPVVITQHFTTKRATAIGVMFAGSYIGFSILPSIVEFLLERYGLSGSFLWLSGFVLHCVPLSMLLRKPDFENNPTDSKIENGVLTVDVGRKDGMQTVNDSVDYPVQYSLANRQSSNSQNCQPSTKENCQSSTRETKMDSKSCNAFKIFLEPIFVLVLFSSAVYGGSFIAFVTVIVDLTRDLGLPLVDGKYVIMVFSLASNMGMLSCGWVTDKGYMTQTNFACFMFLFRSATLFAIPFSTGFAVFVVIVGIQGFFESSLACLFPLIVAEYFPDEREMAISSVLFLCGPVYLVTPLVIGFFRDGFGSYLYLFYSMGALSLVCSFLMSLVPRLPKCRCSSAIFMDKNKHEKEYC